MSSPWTTSRSPRWWCLWPGGYSTCLRASSGTHPISGIGKCHDFHSGRVDWSHAERRDSTDESWWRKCPETKWVQNTHDSSSAAQLGRSLARTNKMLFWTWVLSRLPCEPHKCSLTSCRHTFLTREKEHHWNSLSMWGLASTACTHSKYSYHLICLLSTLPILPSFNTFSFITSQNTVCVECVFVLYNSLQPYKCTLLYAPFCEDIAYNYN